MATQTLTRRAPDASTTPSPPSHPKRIVDIASSLEHDTRPDPSGDEQSAPHVWKCRLPSSGEVVAIVRTEAKAREIGSETLVFTLTEVAIAIEAFGQTTLAAKRTFPGAVITAVRDRSPESKAPPKAGHRERSTPKLLPTSDSYQSLAKKMPKTTRYRGESHPASDIAARYAEHMANQRAAASASRGDRDE